jgi:hypothetical protein
LSAPMHIIAFRDSRAGGDLLSASYRRFQRTLSAPRAVRFSPEGRSFSRDKRPPLGVASRYNGQAVPEK